MRFLLVNYEYPPVGAGAATASQAIARALVDLGHDAVVLTGKYKGLAATAQDDGVTVRRVPSFRRALDHSGLFEMASFVLSAMVTVPALVRRHKIQAIIAFFSLPCGPIGLFARWRCGVPYLVSLRGGDVPGTEPSLQMVQRLLTPLRRAVLKNSVAIVANSDGLREMAEAADPFPFASSLTGLTPNCSGLRRRAPPEWRDRCSFCLWDVFRNRKIFHSCLKSFRNFRREHLNCIWWAMGLTKNSCRNWP